MTTYKTATNKLVQVIDGDTHEVYLGSSEPSQITVGNTNLKAFFENWEAFKSEGSFVYWGNQNLNSKPTSFQPNIKIWYNPDW